LPQSAVDHDQIARKTPRSFSITKQDWLWSRSSTSCILHYLKSVL